MKNSVFSGFGVAVAVLGMTSLMPIAFAGQEQAPVEQPQDQPASEAASAQPSVQTDATDEAGTDTQEATTTDLSKFSNAVETSEISVEYDLLIGFMNSYTAIDKNRVKFDYQTIRTSGARPLVHSLQAMRDVEVSRLSKTDQLAYWLNLRNQLVIFAVTLENATNLADERGTFDEPGEMWTEKRIIVDGVNLSIDDIERGIILANWPNFPNIFYGLYQGVEDGPPLFKPGFRGDTVHDVLAKLGKRYVNQKKVITAKGNTVNVPGVYGWYGDVLFEGDEAKLIKHFKRHAGEKLRGRLNDVETISLSEIGYAIDTATTVKRKRKRRPAPTGSPSIGTPGGGSTRGRSGS